MGTYLCRNGFFLVTKFKIVPATHDAGVYEIFRTAHINKWGQFQGRRVHITITHVPVGILIGDCKVQPWLFVQTVWAVALSNVASEEPRLWIRFLRGPDRDRDPKLPSNSPVHHCAGREHVRDGEERIEHHRHTQQHIINNLISAELPDTHKNRVQRVIICCCCRCCCGSLRIPRLIRMPVGRSRALAPRRGPAAVAIPIGIWLIL